MMRLLSYVPATLFLLLAGYANVLFALSLSKVQHIQLFWVGVAVASTLYTVTGLSLCAAQWRRREYARCFCAGMLMLGAVAYDGLAAYGLSRAEQLAASAEVARQQRALDAAQGRLDVAKSDLKAVISAPSVQRARVDVTAAKSRAEKDAAARALASALDKESLASRVATLESEYAAMQAPAPDARAELLPAQWVAWGPVVLVTLGALVGLYSIEAPRPAPREKPAPRAPVPAPEASPVPRRAASADTEALLTLCSLPDADADADGWLRMSQRRLASLLGVSAPKANRVLRKAAAEQAIELATSGGTAFRPKIRA